MARPSRGEVRTRRSPRDKNTGSLSWDEARGQWEAKAFLGLDSAGNPIRPKRRFRLKEEANAWLSSVLTDHSRGLVAEPSSLSVAAYLGSWLETKAREVRASTVLDYRKALQGLVVPAAGRVKLQAFTARHVERMLGRWHEQGVTAYSARKALRHLKRALNDAVRLELLTRNPAALVRPPRAPEARRKRFTGDEARTLLAHLALNAPELHAYAHTALTTGLRRSELLGLRWADLALEAGLLTVSQAVTYTQGSWSFGAPKTAAARRTIHLDAGTVTVLEAHRDRLELYSRPKRERGTWQDHDLVFPSRKGTPQSESRLGLRFREACAAAGVPNVTLYGLRHSYASLSQERGVPVKLYSERLGHTNVAFTMQQYVHTSDEQRRGAALSADDLFGPKPETTSSKEARGPVVAPTPKRRPKDAA